jgi:hypothetical protein
MTNLVSALTTHEMHQELSFFPDKDCNKFLTLSVLQIQVLLENVNDEDPSFTSDMTTIRSLNLKENEDNSSIFLITAKDEEFSLPLRIYIQVSTTFH